MIPEGKLLSVEVASLYRTMVGKLFFAANTFRTDLAYAASALSRFIKIPYANQYAAAKHILWYIKCTLGLAIVFKKSTSFDLFGYCDSDLAGDKADSSLSWLSTC